MNGIEFRHLKYSTLQSSGETQDSELIVALNPSHEIVGRIDLVGTGKPAQFLIALFVQKEYRGHGIGSVLVQRAMSSAKKNPATESVYLTVARANSEAVSLYRKLGFMEAGSYETNGIYMTKSLLGESA